MSAVHMSLRELFALIAPDAARADGEALRAALHDSDGTEGPLLVRVFTAVGTWIGAVMIAFIFAAMELYEVVPVALLLGAGLFAGAIVLSRRPGRSLVLTQLIWAMALGAHGLVAMAFAELDVSTMTLALTWTGLSVATMFFVQVPSFALVSAISAVGFGTWFAAELDLPAYALWVALPVAGLATAAWIYEVPWSARLGRTWSALAYGLPIGVAGPLSLAGIGDEGSSLVAHGVEATVATLILLALIAVVLLRARAELGGTLETRAYMLGVIAVLAGLAARHVPGLTLAILWLLVAHLRKSAGLQTIASMQLAGFLFFFYYQLETTLLLKSLWVLSTGAVILIGAVIARRPRAGEPKHGAERRSRWIPALILALATSGIVVGASVHKQRILATGQTLLLPLAPVDPRSLMQGDYMALRYALDRELDESLRGEPDPDPDSDPELELWREPEPWAIPRHGALIVRVDGEGVGHFARLDDGGELAADELRLEYRLRDEWSGRLRIGGESYLFEEGSAELYESARYGELIVAEDGEAVLVGLRGEDRQPLGVRLHGVGSP